MQNSIESFIVNNCKIAKRYYKVNGYSTKKDLQFIFISRIFDIKVNFDNTINFTCIVEQTGSQMRKVPPQF